MLKGKLGGSCKELVGAGGAGGREGGLGARGSRDLTTRSIHKALPRLVICSVVRGIAFGGVVDMYILVRASGLKP